MKVQINTDKNVTITPLIKWIKVVEKLTERPDKIDKNVVISDFCPDVKEECDI